MQITPELEAMSEAIADGVLNDLPSVEIARAALLAIREPSEGMFDVGILKVADAITGDTADPAPTWRAMIDHILGGAK